MALTTTPYSSAMQFVAAAPSWLSAQDAERLAAYKLYEDIYWMEPQTFKVVMRGSNDTPIYLPSGRIICNTMNRYVGRGWRATVDPAFGSDAEKALAQQAFASIWAREKMTAQYNSNKLFGHIRGDSCWYITANAEKPEGKRLSVRTLDPGMYFPIPDDNDEDRVWGVDIVEQLVKGDKTYVKRTRYLKSDHPEHPSGGGVYGGDISVQIDSFEMEGWEDPTKQKRFGGGEVLAAEVIPGITNLPVYHIPNNWQPGDPFGISEMRGLPAIFAGLNQRISDEALALALEGLGLYWTNAGGPVDSEGNEVPWGIGPGEVVEIGEGKTFGRVSGVNNIDASQKHMEFLQDQAFRVSGASDVAQGRVDVQVAESGIALKLRMGPILDEAALRQEMIKSVHDQMLYDLRQWLRVYEGINLDNTMVVSDFEPNMPEDKAARFKMLLDGYQAVPPLWSGQYVRDELRRMGYEIPQNMLQEITDEQAAYAEFSDPYAVRAAAEADPAAQDAAE